MSERRLETNIGTPTLIKLEARSPLESSQINIHSPYGDVQASVSAGEEGLAIVIGESTYEIKPNNITDYSSPQIITTVIDSHPVSFKVEWLRDNPQGEALIFLPVSNSSEAVAA